MIASAPRKWTSAAQPPSKALARSVQARRKLNPPNLTGHGRFKATLERNMRSAIGTARAPDIFDTMRRPKQTVLAARRKEENRQSRPQKHPRDIRKKSAAVTSDVISPPWASTVGSVAQRKHAVRPPAAPNSRPAQQ